MSTLEKQVTDALERQISSLLTASEGMLEGIKNLSDRVKVLEKSMTLAGKGLESVSDAGMQLAAIAIEHNKEIESLKLSQELTDVDVRSLQQKLEEISSHGC